MVKRSSQGSHRASGRAQGKTKVKVKVVNVAVECDVFDRLLLMLLLLLVFSPHHIHLQGFYWASSQEEENYPVNNMLWMAKWAKEVNDGLDIILAASLEDWRCIMECIATWESVEPDTWLFYKSVLALLSEVHNAKCTDVSLNLFPLEATWKQNIFQGWWMRYYLVIVSNGLLWQTWQLYYSYFIRNNYITFLKYFAC